MRRERFKVCMERFLMCIERFTMWRDMLTEYRERKVNSVRDRLTMERKVFSVRGNTVCRER